MSFAKTNLQDWEKLVAKQLKTEDIYKVLEKKILKAWKSSLLYFREYRTSKTSPSGRKHAFGCTLQ